ncbi:hypothetical protein RDI58_024555 [Solanum bulbocastanum]|uniref:Protein kinase domain-containing protein n=1 Tax=Solanum bulbocastanum TaxID=147425 RepID=A0AAN8Y3K6_SOLBU
MPTGSLDYHLFKGKSHLTWSIRFKIAQGLASVLLYLHDLCEKFLVHRDIKSRNIMLDSYFNASKETNVYNFGVVALEIGCGRKPIDPKVEEHQVEHLLVGGLWCAHLDNNCSPSIRQTIQVLNFEAPKIPVPTYCSMSQYGQTTLFASPYDSNGSPISEVHSSGTRDYTGSSNNTAASAAPSPSASFLYTR